MHCYICDRMLSDSEIILNKDTKTFEPCSTCLEISLDAAFSGGYTPDGDTTPDEISVADLLDTDAYISDYGPGDLVDEDDNEDACFL